MPHKPKHKKKSTANERATVTTVTKPTVIITGASGFLGATLVEHFSSRGWHVIALVRDPSRVTGTNIRSYAYELGKPVDAAAFKDADYLIHTAYVKYDHRHPDAMDVNITGAKQLLAVSRAHKLKTTIFLSSMSSHKDAISVYGKQKLAIEALFNTSNDLSIRSGMIIGYGGILKEMVDFMRTKRIVPLVGGGTQPLQTIAIYDLAICLEKCLTKHLSGVLTVAGPTVYTYRDFYAAIGKRIHVTPFYVPVPFYVLQTALKLAGALHISLSISEDNLLGLKKLRAVDTTGDMRRIGVTPDSLEMALKRTTLPH